MVDSADHEKIDASKNELHSLLDKPQLAGIPVRYFLYPSPPPLFIHPCPILLFPSPFLSPNTLLSPPCSLSLYLLSTSSYPILFCPPPSFSSPPVVSPPSSSLPQVVLSFSPPHLKLSRPSLLLLPPHLLLLLPYLPPCLEWLFVVRVLSVGSGFGQ